MYASNQFPVKQKARPVIGRLWYFPYEGHSGQLIMTGKWWELEQERKRLKQMGYKYENFKKTY